MSEATIVIDQVFTAEGDKNGKHWKRYDIKAQDGLKVKTFQEAQGKLAQDNRGRTFKIEYETNEYGNDLKLIKGPVDDASVPTPTASSSNGSASTRSAKDEDIARAVALKAAVASLTHTIPADAKAKGVSDKVLPLAQTFEIYLNTGKAPGELADKDIPF